MTQISALINKCLFVTLGLTFSTLIFAQQPFQTYDMIVSDPAGVVAALDKFKASQTGQQASSTVVLSQYLANGESLATHQILVLYPTILDMDLELKRNATSDDWSELLTDIRSAASVEAEGIGQVLATAGNPNDPVMTAIGRTRVTYQLSVDDPTHLFLLLICD